jgi:hypothetical protein
MGFDSFRRMNPGDRCVGLPRRHHPLSEFLTLSAFSSRPGLVALFRATSAHRISAFRAFPSRPAVTPSGARDSRAVFAPASWNARLQSFVPTQSPYSEPLPLGTGTSRCSHDLSPLRGLPIQPLGLRPPLVCFLRREPRRPKTLCLLVSRHFRVSIRLGLGATPKTGSNLRGVCNLFRSPRTLRKRPARTRAPSASPRAVTLCEEPLSTEANLGSALGVT